MNNLRRMSALLLIGTLALAANSQDRVYKLARNEKAVEQAVAEKILVEIYKRAGLKVEVESLPAARASQMGTSGEKDGEVARIQSYGDKFPALHRVQPSYYYLLSAVIAKADRNIAVASKEDLKKYKVCIIRGIQHAIDATAGLSDVIVVDNADQAYQMLDAGRADLIIDAGINGDYMIKKLGLKGIKTVAVLAKLELFHYLNGKNAELGAKLGETVKKLRDSGELAKIIAKAETDFLASGIAP